MKRILYSFSICVVCLFLFFISIYSQESTNISDTLIYAVTNNDYISVEKLIINGANPNYLDKDGWSALMHASRLGNYEIVSLLISKGASITEKSRNDAKTILPIACDFDEEKESKKIVRYWLIGTREDPYYSINDILKRPVYFDADKKRKKGGQTPLMFAANGGNIKIVETLIERGADVNIEDREDRTALFFASGGGYSNIVKLLIEKGAKVDIRNNRGATPLFYAADAGHVEVAKMLIENGAKVNNKSFYGKSALGGWYPLLSASFNGHLDMVSLLVDNGANVNATSNAGLTSLMLSCINGHLNVVLFLIDKKADLNKRTKDDRTALRFSEDAIYPDIAKLLREKDAK